MAEPPFALDCFVYDGWRPLIRPAGARRDWMDASPEAFAYRCLPLDIANAHGWELLNPHGFSAIWNGGGRPEDVTIEHDPATPPHERAVALFGQGTITFHVAGLFRTPPGWNLFVSGSPNFHKDAIAPLGGVIETDWAPYTFTMNWRFTRAHQRIRFEPGEPFAFFFPVERDRLEGVRPRVRPIEDVPDLKARFEAWSRERDAFHARMKSDPRAEPAAKWQKHYYRGVDVAGDALIADHRTKLRLHPFAGAAEGGCPVRHPAPERAALPGGAETMLAERDWLLGALERQRALDPIGGALLRLPAMAADQFLSLFYAPARAVVLTGATDGLLDPAEEGVRAEQATGAATPLAQARQNLLVTQGAGRRQLTLVPPGESPRIADPVPQGVRRFDVEIAPGEAVFVPIGWWHRAAAIDAGETLTFTRFRWPN